MTLTRWDPFGSIEWSRPWPERWRRWRELEAANDRWLRVEEMKEDDTLVIRAEMPGIDPDKDVEVSVTDSMLHITAKREERTEHKDKGTYRSEFNYGEFSRDIPLPDGVHTEDVHAQYTDGILEVRIPWPAPVEKQPVTRVPVTKT